MGDGCEAGEEAEVTSQPVTTRWMVTSLVRRLMVREPRVWTEW